MATHDTQPMPAHQLHRPAPTQIGQGHFTTGTTASNLTIPRGPVETVLPFFNPPADGSTPWNYVEQPPAGYPQRNYDAKDISVQMNDLRGRESEFTLDNNAFEVFSSIPSSMSYDDWDSDDVVKDRYYPEVTQLLLDKVPGSNKVILFDHTIRRAKPGSKREPVVRVHIDQTPSAAAERVRMHASSPEEAEKLLAGRYRIINVWRPLNGPVYSFPLAVADSATVRDEELVPIEHRYPHRTGETAGVQHHPDQKWYYWSGMQNDERLFLKCFDSDETYGPTGRVPHTAFKDPRTPENAPGRESIEVRALVFG